MAPDYVLDACVLYPVVLRDRLLTLAALDAFEPRWTEETLDFMVTNGDGYGVLGAGTNVLQPGDALLDIVVDYIGAHSPVAPVVQGRLVMV